jgi:fatty acid CoA ligase FadD9
METMSSLYISQAERANADRLEISLKRLAANGWSDPELRRSEPLPSVIQALQSDRLAAIEVFARACEAYADRPALGERAFVLDHAADGQTLRFLPEFRTISYEDAWRRTVELATGLVRDGRTAFRPGEIAGIVGFGSIDYVIADLACLYAGVTSAVLQMSMGPDDLKHIVNEGAFKSLISTREALPAILSVLPACPSVRSVVVMDLHEGAMQEAAELERVRSQAALPVLTLAELAAHGRAAAPLEPWLPAAGTDPLATLMYTSGSTGFPKGAMITQRIWRSHWQLRSLAQFTRFPNIGINFYPLSHAMGRNAVLRTLMLGGVMHFTLNSDMSTLFEDIRLTRPTFLNLVPRISEMIHQAYEAERQRLAPGPDPAAAEARLRAAWSRSFLGDRLTAVMIGSAPTAPEIMQWLSECFQMPVYEGYGSTEAGVLSIDTMISRPTVSSYRLVDVPELGYRLSDQPYPRGELVVKTDQSIPGFFQNEAATRALYDAEGFLRTGDIVEERAPDQVVWVDRINNVVKLSQGEYVTLWRLESLFSGGSPLLDQVYLYANSQRAHLLAVVVPHWTALNERMRQAGKEATPGAVRQMLRGEFNRIAGEARLRPYEVPREILVEADRWTRENGLLTGVNKPARPQLKQRYGERLEALYRQLEQQRQVQDGDDQAPLAVRVRKAVEAVLGVPDLDLASGSFKDLGGDSISALSLALRLEEVCGWPVPVAAILNPGSSMQTLVRQLEARRSDPGGLPSFGAIHGQGATLVRAEDLRLEGMLDAETLAQAAAVAALPLRPVKTVLLTGANGFLGHVLCLQWLQRMAETGGKVVALVRAADDQAAAARLRAAYRTGDDQLPQRFTDLASGGRLEVLAGDLTAPRLGLAASVYDRLAGELDLIVHPGAMVNHVYTYEQLFEPNVLGTAQLIRLALQTQPKRFDYVSTIGVLVGALGSGKVLEQAGVDALQPVWPVSGGYAQGYATSKWACEVLLKELHQRFGLPVRVFRPDMILPDRRFRGQANVPDLMTRLLASVVYTGLAPRSFYAGGTSRAHYDGLPVDFIAAAMVAMSSAGQEGHGTYQVSNAHWEDGVSLDTLIDWVVSAGYAIERVPDHAAWFAAFTARLEALPPEQRQHSSLPILRQWAEPSRGAESERVDASRFDQEVRRLKPGGEAEIPHLTEAFVHKYLEDLRALGILKS